MAVHLTPQMILHGIRYSRNCTSPARGVFRELAI